MKKIIKIGLMTAVFLGVTSLTSCKKYRKYESGEVVENTFSGNVDGKTASETPFGDFTGDGDSGKYSFVWDNPEKTADVRFDITSSSGSVQMIINDARGNEVLNETRSAGGNDTFSGVTDEGRKGKWLVTLVLSSFDGDGSFSINPGN